MEYLITIRQHYTGDLAAVSGVSFPPLALSFRHSEVPILPAIFGDDLGAQFIAPPIQGDNSGLPHQPQGLQHLLVGRLQRLEVAFRGNEQQE